VLSIDQSALASIAGLVGLVGRATWPAFSTRVGVLNVQLLIAVAFTTHYALIGMVAPAIVNALGSLQTATALFTVHARSMRYVGYGLIVVMAAVTFASWAGAVSLLVVIGQAFIVIARMQKDVFLIFPLLLVGQLLWGIHDILVGSPVAIAADAVGLFVGAWMLGRHWTAAQPKSKMHCRFGPLLSRELALGHACANGKQRVFAS
jgi:Bacterial inner membrane protein